MRINYEGYAETKDGRRFPIKVDSYGRFVVYASAVSGTINDLRGDSPEDIQADLDTWVLNAEASAEHLREERREKVQAKKQQAAKVGNTEAWREIPDKVYNSEPLFTYKQVTVRGQKARSRMNEALITTHDGRNTSVPVSNLKLGTAEDIEEIKTLKRAAWQAEQDCETIRRPWSYGKHYSRFQTNWARRLEGVTVTYGEKGIWTVSAEGIKDFTVGRDLFHRIERMAEYKLVAIGHPYIMQPAERNSSGVKVVGSMTDYDGHSPPEYVFPDRETAQAVVNAHNAVVVAKLAVNAWNEAHRYSYAWKEEQGS